jgi:hypothetical protein
VSELRFEDLSDRDAVVIAHKFNVPYPFLNDRAALNACFNRTFSEWRFERDRVGEISARPPVAKPCKECGR